MWNGTILQWRPFAAGIGKKQCSCYSNRFGLEHRIAHCRIAKPPTEEKRNFYGSITGCGDLVCPTGGIVPGRTVPRSVPRSCRLTILTTWSSSLMVQLRFPVGATPPLQKSYNRQQTTNNPPRSWLPLSTLPAAAQCRHGGKRLGQTERLQVAVYIVVCRARIRLFVCTVEYTASWDRYVRTEYRISSLRRYSVLQMVASSCSTMRRHIGSLWCELDCQLICPF